ncbi:hypothetical protein Tco_0766579 [Tanacetum coccineum]
MGDPSSQTHEKGDVYITEKELHQLHLNKEALRETLEKEARGEKEREKKIRQKQADDELFMLKFEESAEEHDIGNEYLTKGYLTEKEQQQLLLDEEALRETLEEETKAEKE